MFQSLRKGIGPKEEFPMQLPVQVTFRNLDASPSVEARVRARIAELEQFYDRIVSCRVMIEKPSRRRRHGDLYHVRVDLRIPNQEIVVNREPPERHAHEDILVAVHDCFDAVRRQLEDHVRQQRGDVKTHKVPGHGRIASLIAEKDYGFISASDGSEIYFHRNAVADGAFDRLTVGDEVRLVVHPDEGEKGPQASTVVPIGKHHLPPARKAPQ
jgi:cold shock CspA family protein/ribosome-associated translation inhibitor RaiA